MAELDFRDKHKPSLNAVRTKFELESINKKTTYYGNDKLIFHIPSNMPNTFLDTAYGLNLKFKINLGSITASNSSKLLLVLDKAGAMSCINRIMVRQAGVVLTELSGANVLACLMKSYETNALYCGNQGLLLEGMKQQAQGAQLEFERNAAGAQITPERAVLDVCVPLNYTVLSSASQNIPLFSKAPIEIELTYEIANRIGAYELTVNPDETPAVVNTLVSYTEVKLQGYFIEISQQAMSMIDEAHGGIYKIVSNNWTNVQDIVEANVKSFSSNIPVNVSSLNRVLAVHRDSTKIKNEGDIVDSADATYPLSLGHHIYPDIDTYQFNIDGEKFPSVPVRINPNDSISGDEFSYQLENTDDSWGLYASKSSLCAKSGASNTFKFNSLSFVSGFASAGHPWGGDSTNIASFASGYDFEIMNEGKADKMYNGRSTVGSQFNYNVFLDNGTDDPLYIDYFAQHTVMLILNKRGAGVFEYYQ